MSLFIGIEGIGMRCSIAVASDEQGKILAVTRLMGRPLTFHTIPRDTWRINLHHLLRNLAMQLEGGNLNVLRNATICIGLAGVTFPYDAHVDLPNEFDKLEIAERKLICTGDAEIIFTSHTQCDRGSVIICSSGSTACIATPDGRKMRFGGWGPALGDEGSGYWMGRSALRAIGEEHDLGSEPSILWWKINEWLSSPDPKNLGSQQASQIWRKQVQRFDTFSKQSPRINLDRRTVIFAFAHEVALVGVNIWRSITSSLVTPIMAAWEVELENMQNNGIATRIVHEAANHLIEQYVQACAIAKVEADFGPIVLSGGVLMHNERFRHLVIAKLETKIGRPLQIITAASPKVMRPVYGAILYALGDSHTGHLRLPHRHVVETVLRQSCDVSRWEVLRIG